LLDKLGENEVSSRPHSIRTLTTELQAIFIAPQKKDLAHFFTRLQIAGFSCSFAK
jgi:hypothetical protein